MTLPNWCYRKVVNINSTKFSRLFFADRINKCSFSWLAAMARSVYGMTRTYGYEWFTWQAKIRQWFVNETNVVAKFVFVSSNIDSLKIKCFIYLAAIIFHIINFVISSSWINRKKEISTWALRKNSLFPPCSVLSASFCSDGHELSIKHRFIF
jgi:hypothetical protein